MHCVGWSQGCVCLLPDCQTVVILLGWLASRTVLSTQLYDIQLVMGGRYYSISPDEYIFAALNIYLVSFRAAVCVSCVQCVGAQSVGQERQQHATNQPTDAAWLFLAFFLASSVAAGHRQPVHLDAVADRAGKQQQLRDWGGGEHLFACWVDVLCVERLCVG